MPKPVNGVNGSGMHVHQSIMSTGEKENLFYEKRSKYGISDLGILVGFPLLSLLNMKNSNSGPT